MPHHHPISETVENYLKAIYTLSEESPAIDRECTITRLAALVGVTKGSATSMIKKLAAGKLVKYEKYGLITLTAKGRHLASDVLRRHRIVEQFLVQVVGLDWSEVHVEAERLEHAISPLLLDRLDAMLGRPEFDPHGDPIPRPATRPFTRPLTRQGQITTPSSKPPRSASARPHPQRRNHPTLETAIPRPAKSLLIPLAQCLPGQRVEIARITDQAAAFLRFLTSIGIKPGVHIKITDVDPARDVIRLIVANSAGTFTGRSESLGCTPAGHVLTHAPA